MNPSAIATDKRTIDHDGRLRVPGCRISKANVCPYYGREIPGFEMLGLDSERVYMMYRDPDELRKAADSFNTVPLLDIHVPVTADAHEHQATVGVISNTRFEYPYLVGDVTVWTQDAKDLIETEEQRELSSAYRYVADMRPGNSPDGVAYHGVMRQIMGNHVALVKEGRAGPDVMVADEKPLLMKFPKLSAALEKLFAHRTEAEVITADGALAEEIDAMDAGLSDEEKKAAYDAMGIEKGCASDALSDEDKTEALRRAAADKRAKDTARAGTSTTAAERAPTPAMDVVAVKIELTPEFKVALDSAVAEATKYYILATDSAAAVTAARDTAAAPVHALYAARDAVADKCGLVNIAELKTAEAVYRYALDKLTIPHKDVPAEALAALYTASARVPVVVTTDATPFNPRTFMPGLDYITRG